MNDAIAFVIGVCHELFSIGSSCARNTYGVVQLTICSGSNCCSDNSNPEMDESSGQRRGSVSGGFMGRGGGVVEYNDNIVPLEADDVEADVDNYGGLIDDKRFSFYYRSFS